MKTIYVSVNWVAFDFLEPRRMQKKRRTTTYRDDKLVLHTTKRGRGRIAQIPRS